jgi:hypothetical protein
VYWTCRDWKVRFTVEVENTAVHGGAYNGTFEFVLFGKKPPVWQGHFTDKRGKRQAVRVRLLRD